MRDGRGPPVARRASRALRNDLGHRILRDYGPEDLASHDPARDLGAPGEFPFTRGVQPTMYRGRFWTMRQYSGFGNAEETNRRFRYLLEQGQTGLSVAFTTGASQAYLSGLANANADTFLFRSGAGDYTLDFSGTLMRDLTVDIESAVSSITIIVAEGVSARVSFSGGLTNVDYRGEWEKDGSVYVQSASGPEIRITVSMGAGTLKLRNR